MAIRMLAAVAVACVGASLLASGAVAQTTNPPSCASKLVGCAAYMNGTDAEKPPATCCEPLKEAVKNDLKCLCALYASPEIFKAFSINITDALRLSKRCGVSESTSSCSNVAGAPSGNPDTKSPSGGKNAGHRTNSVSLAGLMSMLLVLLSVLA